MPDPYQGDSSAQLRYNAQFSGKRKSNANNVVFIFGTVVIHQFIYLQLWLAELLKNELLEFEENVLLEDAIWQELIEESYNWYKSQLLVE